MTNLPGTIGSLLSRTQAWQASCALLAHSCGSFWRVLIRYASWLVFTQFGCGLSKSASLNGLNALQSSSIDQSAADAYAGQVSHQSLKISHKKIQEEMIQFSMHSHKRTCLEPHPCHVHHDWRAWRGPYLAHMVTHRAQGTVMRLIQPVSLKPFQTRMLGHSIWHCCSSGH